MGCRQAVRRALRREARVNVGVAGGDDGRGESGRAFDGSCRRGRSAGVLRRDRDTATRAGLGVPHQRAARPLPGDDLVAGPRGGATMATTLPAPPEDVWPWLVQMGGDRGGWYGWDQLDNNGNPSDDRIVAAWQHLSSGQELLQASAPGAECPELSRCGDRRTPPDAGVARQPPHVDRAVLRATLRTGPWGICGRHLGPSTDARHLACGTRLVVRTRIRSGPSPPGASVQPAAR